MRNKTRWDALSMRDRASLIRLYAQGGVLDLKQMKKHYNSFDTGGDKVNYRIKGQDWSTWTPSQVQEAIDWGVAYPEQFFGEEGAELRDRLSRAGMADSVIGSIYNMAPKEIQEAVGDRYKSTAQREAEYASGITSAIDNAGKDIVNKILPTDLNNDLDNNALGFTPIAGDILQGIQGVRDITSGNYLKGAIGLGMLAVPNLVEKPLKAIGKQIAYKIQDLGGGYMLKSLMRGNPLEKQISKNGTINVNNVRSLINKSGKVEQAVVDKVLASEEFAGKKAIDYNEFRKAVQDELITYERTPTTKFEEYGVERLGFYDRERALTDALRWDPEMSEPIEFLRDDMPELSAYTFSSPRIPNGSNKYYDSNTLGHSRTYTTADEPDVLHVMESQSDWAQNWGKSNSETYDRMLGELSETAYQKRARVHDFEKTHGTVKTTYDPELNETVEEIVFDSAERENKYRLLKKEAEEAQEAANARRKFLKEQANNPEISYLADNYTTRQIQENLRYAAEKGQTKMRYPTRETAAKIEGYSKSRSQTLQDNPELEKEYKAVLKRLNDEEQRIIKEYASKDYIDESGRDVDFGDIGATEEWIQERMAQERASELFDRSPDGAEMRRKLREAREKYNPDKWLEENVKAVYLPEHETILKKYDAFPKQYQKLFKNADIRIVTDSKGNTWYEVDVPKDYLQQEWVFKKQPETGVIQSVKTKGLTKWLSDKIAGRIAIGTKYKELIPYEATENIRNSDETVRKYYTDIVGKSIERVGGDGSMFETDITGTRKFISPERLRSYGKDVAGITSNESGVAEYPLDASGYVKVHEHRHQRDPLVFDQALWEKSVRDKVRLGIGIEPEEFSTRFINQTNITPTQEKMLKNAYPFLDKIERAPVNREIAYYFYDAYYRTHKKFPNLDEFNAFIDDMKSADIAEALRKVNSYNMSKKSYGIALSNKKAKLIKDAIKGVMGIGPIGIGATMLMQTNDYSTSVSYNGMYEDTSFSTSEFAKGGHIHIKPENRGKFTALKKRTGKTASWFKAHGTPAQKKMATFALNAAKWHKK